MQKVADNKTDLKRGVDHIGVAAGAIVHDGRGRILLLKRGPKARDERGRWDICAGAVEFGENIIDSVRRELAEELCVVPERLEFLTAYDAHREHDGRRTHWIQLLHSALVKPEAVKIGEPHKISRIGWFETGTLPSPLHSQFDKAHRVAKLSGIISS